MSPERHQRLMALFDQACELSDVAALHFVVGLGDGDADLRAPLAGMLVADRHARDRCAEAEQVHASKANSS
jgi:hypothetical protein